MKTPVCRALVLGMLLATAPVLAKDPAACAKASQPSFLKNPVTIQGTCTAQCGDMGGTASVSCQGNCFVQDQDCDSGVRGYVQCQATGARSDCPVCESCSAETPCPEGGSVWCGPVWGYDCWGGSGLCFARCGSQYYFCPGHWGQIIC